MSLLLFHFLSVWKCVSAGVCVWWLTPGERARKRTSLVVCFCCFSSLLNNSVLFMLWLIFLSLCFLIVSPLWRFSPFVQSHLPSSRLFLTDFPFVFLQDFVILFWICGFSLYEASYFHSCVCFLFFFSVGCHWWVCWTVCPQCASVCVYFRTGTGQCHSAAFPHPDAREKGIKDGGERNIGSHCALMSPLSPRLPQSHPFSH